MDLTDPWGEFAQWAGRDAPQRLRGGYCCCGACMLLVRAQEAPLQCSPAFPPQPPPPEPASPLCMHKPPTPNRPNRPLYRCAASSCGKADCKTQNGRSPPAGAGRVFSWHLTFWLSGGGGPAAPFQGKRTFLFENCRTFQQEWQVLALRVFVCVCVCVRVWVWVWVCISAVLVLGKGGLALATAPAAPQLHQSLLTFQLCSMCGLAHNTQH